eukprot:520640_1
MSLSTLFKIAILCVTPLYSAQSNSPNILFIWFDDLGFGDTGYNGGSYPTTILDELANNDAIKINFHYSEQVCSASRSSLLTGRYSWLSGLNSVAKRNTVASYNTHLTLFPELLNEAGYNTFIAGKWHIAYEYEKDLPHYRGFDEGIFCHSGPQYYSRGYSSSFNKFDNQFGEPSPAVKAKRKATFEPGWQVPIHDTYTIEIDSEGIPKEIPIYVGDESYNEDLYTEGIKKFIQTQTADNPFFIYYSQWTPHSSVVIPPRRRPNNDIMDQSDCNHYFDDCTLENGTRCIFCRQVNYASKNIEEIIDELKNIDGVYENTIVIITSDNGAAPTALNAYGFGQSLPYRGIKSGTHEGGIRTPAIIRGGYIEELLEEIGVSECEYNELIHVSDWYHILMQIAGITDYDIDDDHKLLQIWDDIQCKCDNNCNTEYIIRDELIMMRMCGDINDEDKYFYSAYVRQGDWKLVINGSNMVNEACPIEEITHIVPLSAYQYANGSIYPTPNQSYFDNIYWPQFTDDFDRAELLYKSECLEELNGTDDINTLNYDKFEYNSSMLFEISKDFIEACNIGEESETNIEKANELFDYLKQRSQEYNASDDMNVSIGSFKVQMDSFDCNTTYTLPWDGKYESVTVDEIWTAFIEKYESCDNINIVGTELETNEDNNLLIFDKFDNNKNEYPSNYNYTFNLVIPAILSVFAIIVMVGYFLMTIKFKRY